MNSNLFLVQDTENNLRVVFSDDLQKHLKIFNIAASKVLQVEKEFLEKNVDTRFIFCYQIDDNNNVVLNIEKARDTYKQILRNQREPKLKKLDTEYIIAHERNDQEKIAEIVAKKQKYRDITDLVNSCNSIQELDRVVLEDDDLIDFRSMIGTAVTREDIEKLNYCVNGVKDRLSQVNVDIREVLTEGGRTLTKLDVLKLERLPGGTQREFFEILKAAKKRQTPAS